MRPPRVITSCVCCGESGPHNSRGLIGRCYWRHLKAGTLGQFPPLRQALPRRWRLETYAELRERGLTHPEIAHRMGISVRTVERYSSTHTRTEAAA